MSTLTSLNISVGGYIADNGGTLWELRSTTRLDFKFQGTSLTVTFKSFTGANQPCFGVTVDGGTEAIVNCVLGNFTDETVTLFTVTEGDHQVRLRIIPSDVYLEKTGTFVGSGSNPVIDYATVNSVPFSRSYQLLDPFAAGDAGWNSNTNFILPEGNMQPALFSGIGPYTSCPIGNLYFEGTCPSISLYVPAGTRWHLYVDGVHVQKIDAGGSGDFDWYVTFATGTSTGHHEYMVVGSFGNGAPIIVSHVMALGISTATLTPRPKFLYTLDSLSRAVTITEPGDTIADPVNGYGHKLAVQNGWNGLNDGVGSRTTVQAATDSSSWASTYGSDVAIVAILGGTNDDFNSFDPATVLEPACVTLLNHAVSQFPSAKIFVGGMLEGNQSPSASQNVYQAQAQTQWQSAISSVGNSAIEWADMTGIFGSLPNNTAFGSSDGTHPGSAGYDTIAARFASFMAPNPTITDITANSNGTLITATLSVSGCTPTGGTSGFRLGDASDGTEGGTVNLSWSISGTTLTLTPPNKLYPGMTYTLTSGSTGIVDGSGNAFTDVTDAVITNDSTATVSIPSPFAAYAIDSGAVITVGIPDDPNVVIRLTAKYHSNGTVYGTGEYGESPIPIHGFGQIGSLTNGTAYDFSAQQIPFGNFSLADGTPSASTSNITVTPPNSPARPSVKKTGIVPALIAAGIIR
jgi:hypothetical protein